METPQAPKVFGPRYANRALSGRAILLGLAGLVVAVVATAFGYGLVALPLLLPLSLVLVGGGLVARAGLTRPFRIAFDRNGVEVQSRGRTSWLPWADVSAWGVGDPTGGRAGGRLAAVLAWPAAHVTDAGSGGAAAIWSGRAGAWVVCLPHQTDGTVPEIAEAIGQVAPQVPRRDAGPG